MALLCHPALPAFQERVRFHVLLTSYELVSRHLTELRRLSWDALVVDEAHRLKNSASRLFQVRERGRREGASSCRWTG